MLATLATIIAVAGCGGTPMDQQLPVQRERGFARPIDTLGVEGIVPVSGARAWAALPAAFAELGLEINFREPETLRVGTCYQKVRLRLGKEPLSNFVECGDSRGMPNADRYEVALTVLTKVEVTGEQAAKLYTFVLGVGLDASGAIRDRLWCYSKGVLEKRIRNLVEERARAT